MAAELILAPEAGQDIAEAYAWYESRRAGLGEEFLSSVEACIETMLRRNIRIGTVVLSIPVALALALFVFLRLTIFSEPPTLEDLQRDFQSKRADLETILRMFDEHVAFARIAPDFLANRRSSSRIVAISETA